MHMEIVNTKGKYKFPKSIISISTYTIYIYIPKIPATFEVHLQKTFSNIKNINYVSTLFKFLRNISLPILYNKKFIII